MRILAPPHRGHSVWSFVYGVLVQDPRGHKAAEIFAAAPAPIEPGPAHLYPVQPNTRNAALTHYKYADIDNQ